MVYQYHYHSISASFSLYDKGLNTSMVYQYHYHSISASFSLYEKGLGT